MVIDDNVPVIEGKKKGKKGKKKQKEEAKEEAMDDGDEEDESPGEFKQKVVKILEDCKMIEKRSSKMQIVDFLALLNAFNEGGIHFS